MNQLKALEEEAKGRKEYRLFNDFEIQLEVLERYTEVDRLITSFIQLLNWRIQFVKVDSVEVNDGQRIYHLNEEK